MIPHFRDYEVEDEEGNFAYNYRSDDSPCGGNQSSDSTSDGIYPSGESFLRTAEGVYDLDGHFRVPLRFFESKCIICSSNSCIRPHRWFTREGFVHKIGLSGLVRARSLRILQTAAEDEYGGAGRGWNKCEVCDKSQVSSRDREEAGDCRLPHRWYTWEGYVWSLLGEYGADSLANRVRASQNASVEWKISGGVGEDSKYERVARDESPREQRYGSGGCSSSKKERHDDERQEIPRYPSPTPEWNHSSTGEYEKFRDRDQGRHESTTYGYRSSARSQGYREKYKSATFGYSDRYRETSSPERRATYGEGRYDDDRNRTPDGGREHSSRQHHKNTHADDENGGQYRRSRSRNYEDDCRYETSQGGRSGSRASYEDL